MGSYIIKELVENGFSVRAIRRNTQSPVYIDTGIWDQVEWVNGDILDVVSLEDAMQGMDAVIHSAAVVSFQKKDRKAMYQANVDGTANVVNMALEQNISRFVHVSSVAALGRTPDGGHVDEEKKWEETKVNTHYARSKYKGELEVWRGMAEGLNAVIINPSTILGFGDWNSSSCAIFKTIYKGFDWYSPGLNGFVDVEDVAKAAVRLMQNQVTEQRFIINGDNWFFKKLTDTIADNFGVKRPSRKTTPFLMAIAWRWEKLKSLITGHRPLLTKESARVAHSKTHFENNKSLTALPGFSYTPLEKSIHLACQRYKALAASSGL